MASKDHHIKPYDRWTIGKLEIFEAYAEAWIPTFVMQSKPEIRIFDFFSGPGCDVKGIPGSPLRLLSKINKFYPYCKKKNTKIKLYLNEFNADKFELLVQNCGSYLQVNGRLNEVIEVIYYNKDASLLFFDLVEDMEKHPALVYLDQNGVSFISQRFIDALDSLPTTDFLFFVSSSFFRRFAFTPEFKQVLEFKDEEIQGNRFEDIHRLLIRKLKERLSKSSTLKLYPFTIKKGSNIYGIIFGAKHPIAVDKFLRIAWEKNKINGEANFDIDDDTAKVQPDLFRGTKLTKIQKFQYDLKELILNKTLLTNKDAIEYTYNCGHLPDHARELVSSLKDKEITYESMSPLISYDSVYKQKRIIPYLLKTK